MTALLALASVCILVKIILITYEASLRHRKDPLERRRTLYVQKMLKKIKDNK